MIQLSSDFLNRVNNKDTRRLIAAKLFYDSTNFLALSTVASVIDGVQYLPALKDMFGSSMKWDLLGKNNVTVSTPSISIIEYNTPDGYNINDEFNSKNFNGRRMIVYLGYQGSDII